MPARRVDLYIAPLSGLVYFSPGNDGTNGGELWKYNGTTTTYLWRETGSWDPDTWVTCLFWSQVDNRMYMATWSWDDGLVRIYRIGSNDSVTLVASASRALGVTNPLVDAAEWHGSIYLLAAGLNSGENTLEVFRFDPVAGTLSSEYVLPTWEYTGGIAVDVNLDELVVSGGYNVYYKPWGGGWAFDVALDPFSSHHLTDSFGLMTYGGVVYMAANEDPEGLGSGTVGILRRSGPGSWTIDFEIGSGTGNASSALGSLYDPSSGAGLGLYGQRWGWDQTGSPTAPGAIVRVEAGNWTVEWSGPADYHGVWPQAFAQVGGKLCGLWHKYAGVGWGTALYKRADSGTWSLVESWPSYYPTVTFAENLAIAASSNRVRKCHEV